MSQVLIVWIDLGECDRLWMLPLTKAIVRHFPSGEFIFSRFVYSKLPFLCSIWKLKWLYAHMARHAVKYDGRVRNPQGFSNVLCTDWDWHTWGWNTPSGMTSEGWISPCFSVVADFSVCEQICLLKNSTTTCITRYGYQRGWKFYVVWGDGGGEGEGVMMNAVE